MSREMSAPSWQMGCNILVVSGMLSSSKSPKGVDSKRMCTRCISNPERRKPWSRHRYNKRGPSGDLVARCGRIRPGHVWANFVHEVDELVTLVEGEIELSFQGQTL